MDGRLRNMTSLYIIGKDKFLLLFRQGGRVADNVWTGSAGGHFEENELNDARACVLLETKEELPISDMPYTARYMITHFLEIGHETDCIYVGAAGGDGLVFTELPEY